jgi:uncharacterized protein YkwD
MVLAKVVRICNILFLFSAFSCGQVASSQEVSPEMGEGIPTIPDTDNVLFSFGEELMQKVNLERLKRKLPLLFKSDMNICAAGYQAAWLAEKGTCNHEGRYRAPLRERIKLCGGKPTMFMETVGCGFNTAQAVIDAWLKSPPHAKILLNNNHTEFGASFVRGSWVLVITR